MRENIDKESENAQEIPSPHPIPHHRPSRAQATKREMPDRRRYTRTARTPRRSKPVERRRRRVPNVAVIRDFGVTHTLPPETQSMRWRW